MSGTGICRQLQPVPEISFLGLVVKTESGSGSDRETAIYLDGGSPASTKLAVVKRSRDSQSIKMKISDGVTIATVIRAFQYRSISVTFSDFNTSRTEEIMKYIAGEPWGRSKARRSIRNNVSFERTPKLHMNGSFFRIPSNSDKETVVRSGTVLETLIYLLYMLGDQKFGIMVLSEPLHFLCRATQSTLPGRVFLLTLHRPAPGEKFELEIAHSRMGISYPNIYELQVVSGG